MKRKQNPPSAYIPFIKNSKGYILLEALLSILLLIILLTWFTQLILQWRQIENSSHTEIYHFHHMIELEAQSAIFITTDKNLLQFHRHTGEIVTISFFNHKIRRQVNRSGHEELLRDIASFRITEQDQEFYLRIKTNRGEQFEKILLKKQTE